MARVESVESIVGQSSILPKTTERLRGLDAIRYVCAIWVVLNHMGSPFHSVESYGGLVKHLTSVYQLSFCGPAAVIVFFVVSGLCIHFPYRDGGRIDFLSYYPRRYLRIGIPLLAVIILSQLLSHTSLHAPSINDLSNSVLWSLVAEIIYYSLYPALMFVKQLLGWRVLLAAAFGAAYFVVLAHPHTASIGFYPLFGWRLNWLLGLPCWLLGCLLAERLPRTGATALPIAIVEERWSIWKWRASAWAASCLTTILQFHQHHGRVHLGYSMTLDLFAVLVYFWLRQEIIHYRANEPIRWLEAAGAASYSLYLVHPVFLEVLGGYEAFLGHGALAWVVIFCEIILASAMFYLLVERPSHLLARAFRPNKQYGFGKFIT